MQHGYFRGRTIGRLVKSRGDENTLKMLLSNFERLQETKEDIDNMPVCYKHGRLTMQILYFWHGS